MEILQLTSIIAIDLFCIRLVMKQIYEDFYILVLLMNCVVLLETTLARLTSGTKTSPILGVSDIEAGDTYHAMPLDPTRLTLHTN